MSFEPAIRVQGVSKRFQIYERPHHRLMQMLWRGRRPFHREFTALQGIDFEVPHGDTLGIIGHNGAGKSTLLQIICGTLAPSTGQVQVNGRLSALLELGAGFNPEFTGRENMAISAAILGLSPAELDQRRDDILAFADIGEHIDQPVKTYSSGMFVRLAFSVAIHVQPQVLVVDEALAVGDAFFQARCMTRLRRMLDDGLTLLFTSHDVGAVKALCRRSLWLDHGRMRACDDTLRVTNAYSLDWIARANDAAQPLAPPAAPADPGASVPIENSTPMQTASGPRGAEGASSDAPCQPASDLLPPSIASTAGTGDVDILSAGWLHESQTVTRLLAPHGQPLTVQVNLRVRRACRHLVVSFHIKNAQGQHVMGAHSAAHPQLHAQELQPGQACTLHLTVPNLLHQGTYSLTVLAASIPDTRHYIGAVFHQWRDDVAVLEVPPREAFPLSDMVEPPAQVEVFLASAPPQAGADLVILDDFFPNLLTGFRVAEYNALLEALPGLQIYSAVPDFEARHAEYAQRHPTHAHRVLPWRGQCPPHARRAYLNFLNNAVHFLPALQAAQVPFWLTLYPGGGFGLNEDESDRKLLLLLRSSLLAGITVTLPITQQYLTQLAAAHGLPLPPLKRIDGVVVSPDYFGPATHIPPRTWFGAAGQPPKPHLDVAFIAERYMPGGLNKGYPAFVEAARALAAIGWPAAALRFHVVGSCGPEDAPPPDPNAPAPAPAPITWHGRMHTAELQRFLHTVDVVVSPNRPFLLHPGNFDGFPTGACVEASLCGALLIVSDELKQNPGYLDGQELFIIPPTAQAIQSALQALLAHPPQVAAIARAGCQRTQALYHPRQQIAPRLAILQQWCVPKPLP